MKNLVAKSFGAAVLAVVLATPALAHRQWMLPSQTTFSGQDNWVTVDAAVSNDLFYFEHVAGNIANVKAVASDGTEMPIQNQSKGRYRSTFDVHLTKPGTYRIGSATEMVTGSYELNGKTERLPRGTTKDSLAQAIPAGATNVQTSEATNRNELFVSVGAPDTAVFKPSGRGIELVPVTHPNDLVAGEAATFQFVLDGAPTAGLVVTAIPGGIRYRDNLNQIDATTDAEGKVTITYPTAGMYWLNVTTPGGRREGGGSAPAAPQRRASYVTTLEVMAP